MSEDTQHIVEALEQVLANAKTGKYRFVAIAAVHEGDEGRATCAVVGTSSDQEILAVLNGLADEALDDEDDDAPTFGNVKTGQA